MLSTLESDPLIKYIKEGHMLACGKYPEMKEYGLAVYYGEAFPGVSAVVTFDFHNHDEKYWGFARKNGIEIIPRINTRYLTILDKKAVDISNSRQACALFLYEAYEIINRDYGEPRKKAQKFVESVGFGKELEEIRSRKNKGTINC